VKAVLRRATQYDRAAPAPVFQYGDLRVDFGQYRAFIADRPVDLTPTEYRLVAHLARNAGRVVPQDDLLTAIWGPAYRGEAHLLRVNIARLRQKIERDPATRSTC
jgi:two-component system KDP operon response regulator KdpE